jgi:hypothetical protein
MVFLNKSFLGVKGAILLKKPPWFRELLIKATAAILLGHLSEGCVIPKLKAFS